jgi:threonine synthase
MGLPLGKLICASNENNVLFDFFRTGVFDLRKRSLKQTISPAIDILIPSNLARMLYIATDGNSTLISKWLAQLKSEKYFEIPKELLVQLQKDFGYGWCTETNCLETIRNVYQRTNILIDPHTAVAKYVADSQQSKNIMLIASTAHYAKFPETVLKALGEKSDDAFKRIEEMASDKSPFHKQLKGIMEKPIIHKRRCPADKQSIMKEIISFLTKL